MCLLLVATLLSVLQNRGLDQTTVLPIATRAMDVHRWYDMILQYLVQHVTVQSQRKKERPMVAIVRSAARYDDTVRGEGLRCVIPLGDRNTQSRR